MEIDKKYGTSDKLAKAKKVIRKYRLIAPLEPDCRFSYPTKSEFTFGSQFVVEK